MLRLFVNGTEGIAVGAAHRESSGIDIYQFHQRSSAEVDGFILRVRSCGLRIISIFLTALIV